MGRVTFTATVEFANEAEIAMATELIKTLQQITSNLVVQQPPAGGVPSASAASANSAVQHAAAAPQAPSVAPAPAHFVQPQEQRQPEMATAASLVADFGIFARRDAALASVRAQLQKGGEDFWSELFEALQNLLFHPEPDRRPVSSESYVEAMLALPEVYVDLLRKRLTPVLLKRLTAKRPINTPRGEVQSFAELFAVLVKHRVVAVQGALTTMQMLLKKPDNRLAATMMAHNVSCMCDAALLRNEWASLEALRADLMQVQEPAFQQELAITIENLSPSRQVNLQQRPAAPPAQESSPLFQAPQQTQESTQHQAVLDSVGRTGVGFDVTASELSVHEHSGAIFTLTHDPLNDSILTTGRDGKMVTWTQSGTVKQTHVLDNYYACSADINVRHQTLLLCGVPRDAIDPGQPSAGIFMFRRANASSLWERVGVLPRPEMKIVTAVRCIGDPSTNSFATGEQRSASGGGKKDCVCVYDVNSGPFETLRPQTVYWEHDDIITCVAAHMNDGHLFFSGSKDSTIKLWDKRVGNTSAATMGGILAGGGFRPGHTQMITCIDTFDHTLVSAGLDEKILVWDIRMMTSSTAQAVSPVKHIAVGQQAILKIAAARTQGPVGAAGLVAVSSVRGLFVVRICDGVVVRATPPATRPAAQPYHDLKWTSQGLWAGGEDRVLDRFTVRLQ